MMEIEALRKAHEKVKRKYESRGKRIKDLESQLKDAVRLCILLNHTEKINLSDQKTFIDDLWFKVMTPEEVKK